MADNEARTFSHNSVSTLFWNGCGSFAAHTHTHPHTHIHTQTHPSKTRPTYYHLAVFRQGCVRVYACVCIWAGKIPSAKIIRNLTCWHLIISATDRQYKCGKVRKGLYLFWQWVCCSELQWFAVSCSVLNCVAVPRCCSVLQWVCCRELQSCSELQWVAVGVLQSIAVCRSEWVAVCCSVMQCNTVCCSVL